MSGDRWIGQLLNINFHSLTSPLHLLYIPAGKLLIIFAPQTNQTLTPPETLYNSMYNFILMNFIQQVSSHCYVLNNSEPTWTYHTNITILLCKLFIENTDYLHCQSFWPIVQWMCLKWDIYILLYSPIFSPFDNGQLSMLLRMLLVNCICASDKNENNTF